MVPTTKAELRKLVSETTNLLGGLNTYLDKTLKFMEEIKLMINNNPYCNYY